MASSTNSTVDSVADKLADAKITEAKKPAADAPVVAPSQESVNVYLELAARKGMATLEARVIDDSDVSKMNEGNAVFDAARLHAVSDGDEEFELELIDLWRNNMEEKLPLLRVALKAKETRKATLYAHDMKGSSANIGAVSVEFVAKILEDFSKASIFDDGLAAVDALEKEYRRTRRYIDWEYEQKGKQ